MRNFVIAAGLMFVSAGSVWAKVGPVLGEPKDYQIPGHEKFITKAGTSPKYKSDKNRHNVDGELVLSLDHIIGRGWAHFPKGKNDYNKLPNKKDFEENAKMDGKNAEKSELKNIKTDKHGLAVNPFGEKAPAGRGFYGKWGVNFSSDPVVTRYGAVEDGKRFLEILVVQRPKEDWKPEKSIWALPGGMTDIVGGLNTDKVTKILESGENTATREAKEETGINFKPLQSFMKKVYSGYGNDPRATRHAWGRD